MTEKDAGRTVLRVLNDAGFAAFFVGGCVRDTLLGRAPKDFDVTTAATPASVAELFPGNSELVGAHFAVSLVKVGGVSLEVATFRSDGVYSDCRRPDAVTLVTDVREDVLRRDFTVNALLMGADGALVDHVGGLADLRNRTLRCVGDANLRFSEDALRMLRAVRFACQLQFTLHPTVLDAMRTNAYRVSSVSAERVNSELGRAFSANPLMALDLLEDSGLLVHVLPEVAAMNGVTQNPNNHPEGDCLVHTKLLLAHLPNNTPLTLALSALFHDCGKPLTAVLKNGQNTFYSHADVGATLTREVLTRLKFSTDVVETVVSNVAQHMKFFEVQAMRRSTLLRFVRQNNFNELLELHRLDCLASNGDLSNHAFVVEFLNEQTAVDLAPAKLLNGNDLVGLGFTPGPFFKTLLEALETAQLEGQLTTREDAVAFVLNFGA